MVNWNYKEHYGYEDMVRIIHLLRSPGGCPWDQAQTHDSIRRNFLEETYEALEAIEEDDPVHLCEELGDVLTQVIFHGDIEQDAGRFTLEDVYDGVCKKMLLRHPHVFGDVRADSAEEVLTNWDAIKRREKRQDTFSDTLHAVPKNLPATWRAEKLMKKAARAGFAWADAAEAQDKLAEETAELRRADVSDAPEELGDVLFAAVGVACAMGADPEALLHAACEKFLRRFSAMEAAAEAPLDTLPRERLLQLWQEAKQPGNAV